MSTSATVLLAAERRRLDALRSYEVLDTEPETAYDDLVAIVVAALGVPMAAVSLLDQHRQWWKASRGLTGRQGPRDLAVCDVVVRSGRTLVVEDLSDDERFRTHPAVVGGGLRFYAGAPLVAPGGEVIGTLCGMDVVPHAPTAAQVDVLERLARRVVEALELRRRNRSLSRERALLRSTSEVSAMIAAGEPLGRVLDAVARAVERRDPDVLCSVLLVEGGVLRDGAAPSLPQAYRDVVDGLAIGVGVGCCGEVAALGRATESADVQVDPRWAPFREAARAAGLRSCWSTPILSGDGEVLGTFGLYARTPGPATPQRWELADRWAALAGLAITRTRDAERVRTQAVTDPLTGLPNRRRLLEQARTALMSASPERQVALLFLDVDEFKVINDSLGHGPGDEFLVALGARLAEVAGPDVELSRFGGDEFVALVRRVSDPAEPVRLAERLAAAARERVPVGGRRVSLSACVGVAVTGDPRTHRMTLLRNADAALHRAKDLGRDRVVLFDAALHAAAVARFELEVDLRTAVERDELHLAYQPKVDLRTGRVVGVEALARWTHPERGAVPPCTFVPVAEQSGLISTIGEWVLTRALVEHAQRRATDEGWRGVVVWVNIAPGQLTDGLPDLVRACAQDAGVPLDRIGLEVTESSLTADVETARAVLARLAASGIRLALDDFGTGYSSLAQLKSLPFHVLKIDKSFIDGLGRDLRDESIAVAVLGLARAHGLTVVAEGVETAAQARRLVGLECDAAQGYWFARPTAIADLATRYDVPGPLV